MTEDRQTVAEQRSYRVVDVKAAKDIALSWLRDIELEQPIGFGLPEIDDRYHIWRVPLLAKADLAKIGEVVIDARTSLVLQEKSSSVEVLEARLLGRRADKSTKPPKKVDSKCLLSSLRNTIALGDCEDVLRELPAQSVDLVFTSPPYYNARPEYSDFISYEEYLLKMRKVLHNTHRVLSEGRFFVMNIAPVLVRRASRSSSSKRLAVPFDMHRIFVEEGYDFVDDIIWEKPAGAGWATGRGRRFAADRNPLQYKPVPVTEYVLVYRKRTDRLIDWNIRSHPDPSLVKASKIGDDYERTNIWRIKPAHDRRHPAVFPVELASKVIKYYSFVNDVVLDPFAGIGTTGQAAIAEGRRFVLIENESHYVDVIRRQISKLLGPESAEVLTLNCSPIRADTLF